MKTGRTQEWEWPASLDALIAAPQNRRLLQNVGNAAEIRVLRFEVKR
ncbi:MAG: hypothetical protein M3364_03105 [Actinomycetota bacterium]|nr:hypothetical protein [Actinomycetota bacterium]